MSISHAVYGLRLATDTSLPGVPLRHDGPHADVRMRLKESGRLPLTFPSFSETLYTSADAAEHGQPNLQVSVLAGGEYFGFFYSDGARFAVDRDGREVCADWPENYSLEDACTYLVGPVLGFVLHLRGVTCLHASAVAVDDKAIALVGTPGSGKSTTAAAFAQHGFPVLADDIVALTERGERFFVEPGYPRLNLWPDSVRALFGSEETLPRITPTWNKRYMPLGQNGHRFCSESLPLEAIYLLTDREPGLAVPVLEEMAPSEAFVALVANTYVNYLLDREMRAREFDVLARLAARIPVRRLRIPADPSTLPGLCEVIASDSKRLFIDRDTSSALCIR